MKKRELIDSAESAELSQGRLARSFRRNRYLWYAFLFPFVLICLAYLTRGIFPIANRCILTIDLYHQYAPFFSELYEKLAGLDSILYTWNGGLGINFLALSAYYLISPFNLILLLFPRANLPEAIAFIQVLKIGLCAFTMAYYLRKRFSREGIGLMFFGAFYALSAYVLAYSWNVMWLDGVLMLPIIALGLEEMIAGRRFVRYTVALAVTIIFCYYIAYFICLFLIIYFLVAYFSRHPALQFGLLLRKGLKFILFSAIAGGVAAIIVLPTYTALQLTSAANDSFPGTWSLSFTMFDFLTNHLLVVGQHIREGLPNVYSGLSVLLLIPLYFFSPTITTRSKIAYIFGLLALYFSFNFNGLDFIWNGMHYPNQLPYRYAFVYIFLILAMAYPAFIRMREYPPRLLLGLAMAGASFIFLAEKFVVDVSDTLTIYLSVAFIAFIAAGFIFVRDGRRPRELRVTLLSSILIAELLVNTFITVDLMDNTEYYSSREGFVGDRVKVIELMNDLEKDQTGDFYRVELLEPRTVNDTILHSYRGVSIFASTAYLKTTLVMKGLGLHNNAINSYRYNDTTPVLESMLGIRYLVGKDASYSRSHLEAVRTQDEYSIYRNPYALPVGFMAGPDLDQWQISKSNPFDVQNEFLLLSTEIRDVLVQLDTSLVTQSGLTIPDTHSQSNYSYTGASGSASAVFSIDVPETRDVYFYLDANQLDTTEIVIGEEDAEVRRSIDLKRPYIVDLGRIEAGTKIQITTTYKDASSGSIGLYAAGLDDDKYVESMAALAGQGLQVDQFNDSSLSGDVVVETAGTLFTSIPYDSGWTVRVDGQVTEVHVISDGLIGVDLEVGTHRVEMSYMPPRLKEGALISASTLVLFAVILAIHMLLNRNKLPDPPLSGQWPPVHEDTDMATDGGVVPAEMMDEYTERSRLVTHKRHQKSIRHVSVPYDKESIADNGGVLPQPPRNPADARFMPSEMESGDGWVPKEPETGLPEESGDGLDHIKYGGIGEDVSRYQSDQEEDQERAGEEEKGDTDNP